MARKGDEKSAVDKREKILYTLGDMLSIDLGGLIRKYYGAADGKAAGEEANGGGKRGIRNRALRKVLVGVLLRKIVKNGQGERGAEKMGRGAALRQARGEVASRQKDREAGPSHVCLLHVTENGPPPPTRGRKNSIEGRSKGK